MAFPVSGMLCYIKQSFLFKFMYFNRYNTSVQNKFLSKKEGTGDTPRRGNFTIATKTNPYGKIISFFANHKRNAQRIV